MGHHLVNVILLDLAFMILFTVIQAAGIMVVNIVHHFDLFTLYLFPRQSFLEDVTKRTSDGRNFQGTGYIRYNSRDIDWLMC